MTRSIRLIIGLVIGITLSSYVAYEIWFFWNTDIIRVSQSPDQRFQIKIHAYPRVISFGIGGGLEGPGYVALYKKNGDRLAKKEVASMIGELDDNDSISWFKDEVHVRLTATWPLPPD